MMGLLNSAIAVLEKSKKQAQAKMQKEALHKFNLSVSATDGHNY